MGIIPAPRAATKEEFEHDPQYHIDRLEYWARYECNSLGVFFRIYDFLARKSIKMPKQLTNSNVARETLGSFMCE